MSVLYTLLFTAFVAFAKVESDDGTQLDLNEGHGDRLLKRFQLASSYDSEDSELSKVVGAGEVIRQRRTFNPHGTFLQHGILRPKPTPRPTFRPHRHPAPSGWPAPRPAPPPPTPKPTATPAPTYIATMIRNKRGICLHAPDRMTAKSTVQMFTCSFKPNANQQWMFNESTGLIRVDGLCLDAPSRNTPGSGVGLYYCDEHNQNQQWSYDRATGLIKNKNGICLDAFESNTNGGRVGMGQCQPNNLNQQWELPTAPTGAECFLSHVEYPWDIISEQGANSPEACQQICAERNECRFWTYNPANNFCLLNNGLLGNQGFEHNQATFGLVSGPKSGCYGGPWCVRLTTGSGTANSGFLDVFVDGVRVNSGSHDDGTVVYENCHETQPIVEVQNTHIDAWSGTAEASYDGGLTWFATGCPSCSVHPESPANMLVVDGHSTSANQAELGCLGGLRCRLSLEVPEVPEASESSEEAVGEVYTGMDIKHFVHHAQSYLTGIVSDAACQARCNEATGCTAWVRAPETNNCWLSKQTGPIEFINRADRNSGLGNAGRDQCADIFCTAVVCPDGSPLPRRDESDCCGDRDLCPE